MLSLYVFLNRCNWQIEVSLASTKNLLFLQNESTRASFDVPMFLCEN